jgi:hypothetical protein
MKHVKMLSLAAVAAMALMALVGVSSASATTLFNGTTVLKTGSTLDFSLKSATAKLTNTTGTETLDECTGSTVKGKTTNETGTSVTGSLEELTWTGCSVPTSTDNLGGLEVDQIGTTTEGTVKASAEIGVTVNTIFFGVCKYGVKLGNHLGVLKTSAAGTAVFSANATATKLTGSNFACPETTKWVAEYQSTTPDNLRVEA